MTTVIYARSSSNRVDKQERECRELAAREGLGTPTVITDSAPSTAVFGTSGSGWQRVLEMLDAGEVDHLVAWHPSCLWRRPQDLEQVVEAINRRVALRDTKIHTVQAGDIDLATANGRMAARLGAAIAAHASERETDGSD